MLILVFGLGKELESNPVPTLGNPQLSPKPFPPKPAVTPAVQANIFPNYNHIITEMQELPVG